MKIGDKTLLHCKRCKTVTEHTVLHTDQREETEGDPSGEWSLDHSLTRGFAECASCSWPKIRMQVYTEQSDRESFFSIPAEPARPMPHWAAKLPEDIRQLLLEVYGAFTDKRYWLVVMGCRSLIDMFALEKIGDIGGFAQKLKKLEDEGYLAANDRLRIAQAVDVGHGATHRRDAPTEALALAVLDISEHLIQKLALASHAETLNLASAKKAKAGKPKP